MTLEHEEDAVSSFRLYRFCGMSEMPYSLQDMKRSVANKSYRLSTGD